MLCLLASQTLGAGGAGVAGYQHSVCSTNIV